MTKIFKERKIGVEGQTSWGFIQKTELSATIRSLCQADQIYVTPLEEAKRFMVDCFEAVGTKKENAETIASNLLAADNRGHYSHGMNRLATYIRTIKSGVCNPNGQPIIEKETIATALVNGQNGLGSVIGTFCMDLAVKKAKNAGIGMVTAYGSNHFGIAGFYTLQALEKGFLGFSVTNSTPNLVPTRAKEVALGSNPISLAAPGLNGDSFVLDMASAAVALGKIEMLVRKNQPIPEGWVLDNTSTTEMKLLPLGGKELNSSYKGYGLSLMVEVLSGILSGSNYGPNVPKWGADVANLAQAFIAIDPNAFAAGFEGRLSDLLEYLRGMEPIDPEKPVLVAGDPEKMHMEKVKKDGGLIYLRDQHKSSDELAEQLNVKPMKSFLRKC